MDNLKLVLTTRAFKNLSDIAEYYEAKQNGLGVRFVMYQKQLTEILLTMPNIGRAGKIFGTREIVLQDFPYLVVYRVRKKYIQILRIFHQSRKYPN